MNIESEDDGGAQPRRYRLPCGHLDRAIAPNGNRWRATVATSMPSATPSASG